MFKLSSRFRWIFCQLEMLRHCIPPSVRRTLDELPESLDETYERVLREIKKPNREHARRLLQCLVVAIRPLRVEELAEVLAVDFDDEEGIPKLKLNWRWEDQEQALLSSCSSLIAIVESNGSRVVQFSHFSVKEFLTSSRLATSSVDTSRYHIAVEPAHTILAQACLSVLLRSDVRYIQSDVRDSFPLAGYAAEHWVAHAQDEKVSSCVRKAMEYLFDVNEPYFVAWLELHNIDIYPSSGAGPTCLDDFISYTNVRATPLYYAALCGFQDLVEHLTVNDPKQVHATGGHCNTPFVAALATGHFQTAKFLVDNGADPNVRGYYNTTPLLSAAFNGDLETVQVLLKCKADMNARNDNGENALHNASHGYSENIGPSLSKVALLLLKHGANVTARMNKDKGHSTPLHIAARYGRIEVAHVLLQHGANVGTKDRDGGTALHRAAQYGKFEVVRVLLQHGADVGTKDRDGRTALHQAVQYREVEVGRVLLQHGPDVGTEDRDDRTALRQAEYRKVEVVHVLLQHGADVGAKDRDDRTALHQAVKYGEVEVVRMLLQHGADVGTKDRDGRTALHQAAEDEVVRMLLQHGADVGAKDGDGRTALHQAAQYGWIDIVRMLLQHGADVGVEDSDGRTALHRAVKYREVEVVRMLLQHGADVGTKDGDGRTALHQAVDYAEVNIVRMLLEHGADVGMEDSSGNTALQLASDRRYDRIMKLLSEHRAG